jgi:Rieske Fe-S protein
MVQYSGKVFKAFFVFLFIIIGINGCKDDYTSEVPYVYVNFDIVLANKIELNTIGGYYKSNGGYAGIIVINDGTDVSQPFLAFDATCTYELSPSSSVETDGSGIATCPNCGSKYMLLGGYGSPIKGPATQSLKQYHVYLSGGRITVKN